MVDFQSRDTNRGLTEDEEDEEIEQTTEDQEETTNGAEAADEASSVTESIEYDEQSEDAEFAYAVVTIGASGSLEDDPPGTAVVEAIESVGDAVVTRELLRPSYDGIQNALGSLADRDDIDAIVTVGGTGVEPDDVTVDAAADLFGRELPGFGELFRILAHERDGSAVIQTRTRAGLVDNVPVFCVPGQADAARMGVEEIVVTEAPELAADATGPDDEA